MKFAELKSIIQKKAEEQREGDGYDLSMRTLASLNLYASQLVLENSISPSLIHKLDELEVGEPFEFYKEISEHKAKNKRL